MTVRQPHLIITFLLLLFQQTTATFDIGFHSDSDLTSFITRPEIKAPILNVTLHNPNQITPGHFFLAPYVFIDQQPPAKKYYQPCQTGPTIYDTTTGDLIWSGACKFRNQNTCDLRVWEFNNSQYLSAILTSYPGGDDRKGHGVILDSSYDVTGEVHTSQTINTFNMHELNLIEDGTKALYFLWEPSRIDITSLQDEHPDIDMDVGWVADMGFREVDLTTNTILFEWWAARSRHVNLTESTAEVKNLGGPWPKAWDFLHSNSIDKNSEGDYLLSSRYSDTIYKISGEDGHVIWRLGGLQSSFDQDFNFSRQHDARWLSLTPEKEIISFLDNASDEKTNTSTVSSALIVELDRKPTAGLKKARVLNRIHRPDGDLTRLRGNYQVLPGNKSHFICWSENAYLSEHGPHGELLMEARFASKRFVTYRAYKFNFTGTPTEPPTVKAFVYGTSVAKAITVIHVSWNGATDVARWRFRAGDGQGLLLGEKDKTGFETMFQVDGHHADVVAEAVAANGTVLGFSQPYHVAALSEWGTPVHADDGVQKSLADEVSHAAHQRHQRVGPVLEEIASHHTLVLTGMSFGVLVVLLQLVRNRHRIWRCF